MKYNLSMRLLHWLLAVLIIAMLISGVVMEEMTNNSVIEFCGFVIKKFDIYPVHKSFGVLLIALVIIRLIVRLRSIIPPYNDNDEISESNIKLAHLGHYLLYILMFTVPASGFVMSQASGYSVKFFSYQLPTLIEKNKLLKDIASEAHEISSYILMAVIIGHVAAVIKHRKESGSWNILKRMV